MIRTFARAILAPAIIAGALLCAFSTTPAQAASCTGDSCYGKNPTTYCPSGAVTKSYKTYDIGGTSAYWQKRIHSGCQAAWVRVVVETGSQFYESTRFQGRIQSKRKPRGESSYVTATKTTSVITANGFGQSKSIVSTMVPMTSGTNATSRYCWRWDRGSGFGAWACGSWN